MSQITTWEYNGVTLELDLGDADVMGHVERAFDQMAKDEKALKKDGRGEDFIRSYCKMYETLFDTIFKAKGTYKKLTGGKTVSMTVAHETYGAFLEFVRAQSASIGEYKNSILNKYRPNRAARRSSGKARG